MKKQHFAILISACMLLSAPAAIMAEEVTEEVAEEAVETVSEEAAEEETTPAGLEVWCSRRYFRRQGLFRFRRQPGICRNGSSKE